MKFPLMTKKKKMLGTPTLTQFYTTTHRMASCD